MIDNGAWKTMDNEGEIFSGAIGHLLVMVGMI